VFAHLVANGETSVAIGLLFGLLCNLTNIVGILLSLVIWITAEVFGGPYMASSTDIGAAIIYVIVFVGLFLAMVGLYYGVDRYLNPILGRWSFLASGTCRQKQ
jgi:thiosulfate dehydrogenase (quinone) large subunit